jgi:hypothetical protein
MASGILSSSRCAFNKNLLCWAVCGFKTRRRPARDNKLRLDNTATDPVNINFRKRASITTSEMLNLVTKVRKRVYLVW